MAKITKNGMVKMTPGELEKLTHQFYYEGVNDESKNCADYYNWKNEYERLLSNIVNHGS